MPTSALRLLRLAWVLPLATGCALPLLMQEIQASLSENGEPSVVIEAVEPHDLFPGDVVTVKGKGFAAPLGVEFENVGPCVVKDEEVTETQFTCIAPPALPDEAFERPVALVLHSVAGDTRQEEAVVFHKREVRVDGVSPGDVHPGEVLTVTGSGFAAGLVATLDVGPCEVVAEPALTATQFACRTPADLASEQFDKPVGLTVAVGAASARKEGAVTFRLPDVVVSAVTPAEARPGDVLTITGSGFAKPLVAQFQGVGPCAVQDASVTSTQFSCIAHGNVAAYTFDTPVDLVVTVAGRNGRKDGVVTFRRPSLAVTKVEPPQAGAFDLVTMTGTGLTKDTTVKVDTTAVEAFAASADGLSATFRVPVVAGLSGPVVLDVSRVDAAHVVSSIVIEARASVSGSDLAPSDVDTFTSAQLGTFGDVTPGPVLGWVKVDTGGAFVYAELSEVVDSTHFKIKHGPSFPPSTGSPFVLVWKPAP